MGSRSTINSEPTWFEENRRQKAVFIFAHVARRFALSPATVMGRERTEKVAIGRHISLTLARHLLGWACTDAAQFIGRDHTSVIASYRQVEAMRQTDRTIDERYRMLEAELEVLLRFDQDDRFNAETQRAPRAAETFHQRSTINHQLRSA